MKNILFHRVTLTGASVLAVIVTLYGASILADVMDPTRVQVREWQAMRRQNEETLTQLRAEHARTTELRDRAAEQLGKMNEHLQKLEAKGEEIRRVNADLTEKITGAKNPPEKTALIPSAEASEMKVDESTTPTPETQETGGEVGKQGVDLDKLAKAIAVAETGDCTKGYGKEYNNCFGIKNGNTAPCERIGRNNMCIYTHPGQSYDAFKTIWARWYVRFPDRELAVRWTGNDRPDSWLRNVTHHYNKL